ncbi:DUF3667 domain-containing protein [Segetibacter aerophilus]|uniref:DUF3667 domain-containing protein n=1 Tax=Segetibacter aerophilus TaxID=670293 RepID=UPI0011BDC037|nr:DUF3667 domain-containing protein [Segetibacter aerophilus]
MPTTLCKNCDHPVDGNFCSNCGQPAKVHRIDAQYFLHDIPHSILHFDKGFPYTFSQLITRPSKALQEYLDGKRANFFRPLAYVVLMSAISSLLINQIRTLIKQIHFKRTGEVVAEHSSFFSHYQSVFIFLMIPIVSLCTWLVFKKTRFNFWENVLVNTYLAAQLNVLLVLIHLFSLLKFLITDSTDYSLILFMTGFMTYYALTFSGLMYKEISGVKLGLKLALMCFLLASLYATSMSFAGILNLKLGK